MTDIKKVIKGLECCTKWDSCSDCPYQTPNQYDISECTEPLHKDALELLKKREKSRLEIAHETLEGARLMYQGKELVQCKDCKKRGTKNCKIYEGFLFDNTLDNWFCADGKRKD